MLLRELQRHSSEQLMSNRLVRAVMAQRASRKEYVAYMKDVYCYACHSSRVIARRDSAKGGAADEAMSDEPFGHRCCRPVRPRHGHHPPCTWTTSSPVVDQWAAPADSGAFAAGISNLLVKPSPSPVAFATSPNKQRPGRGEIPR